MISGSNTGMARAGVGVFNNLIEFASTVQIWVGFGEGLVLCTWADGVRLK